MGLLGTGAVPIAVAVLLALCVAVMIGQGFIGQGMMFVNQTVVSSILVLALYRSGAGVRTHRRRPDRRWPGHRVRRPAVPGRPVAVLRRARIAVLDAVHEVLSRTADLAAGRRVAAPDWPLPAVDRVHEQLGGADPGPRHRPSGGTDFAAALGAARRRPGRRSSGRARGPAGESRCCSWRASSRPPPNSAATAAASGRRTPWRPCWATSRRPPPLPTRIRSRPSAHVAAARAACRRRCFDRPRTNRGGDRRRRPGLRRRPATGHRPAPGVNG